MKLFQPIRRHNWLTNYVEIPNETKIMNNVEDYPRNISANFGSMCPSDLEERD
jgi:hypothetical protein